LDITAKTSASFLHAEGVDSPMACVSNHSHPSALTDARHFPDLLPAEARVFVALQTDGPADLHPLERAHILGRGVNPSREREFRSGRVLAREALAALGIADFALIPAPTREPQWPEGVIGSISHCGGDGEGVCAVAVCKKNEWSGLGIDMEAIDRIDDRLVPSICTAEEKARLNGVSGRSRQEMLSLVFSAKESIFKAIFPSSRLFLEFQDVSISWDLEHGRFSAAPATEQAPSSLIECLQGRFFFGTRLVLTSVLLSPAPVLRTSR
jgi:4'-phosphopantetheinyl transferase EntD